LRLPRKPGCRDQRLPRRDQKQAGPGGCDVMVALALHQGPQKQSPPRGVILS
jgi:hypothetical protein